MLHNGCGIAAETGHRSDDGKPASVLLEGSVQLLVYRVEKLGCSWACEERLRCGVPLGR